MATANWWRGGFYSTPAFSSSTFSSPGFSAAAFPQQYPSFNYENYYAGVTTWPNFFNSVTAHSSPAHSPFPQTNAFSGFAPTPAPSLQYPDPPTTKHASVVCKPEFPIYKTPSRKVTPPFRAIPAPRVSPPRVPPQVSKNDTELINYLVEQVSARLASPRPTSPQLASPQSTGFHPQLRPESLLDPPPHDPDQLFEENAYPTVTEESSPNSSTYEFHEGVQQISPQQISPERIFPEKLSRPRSSSAPITRPFHSPIPVCGQPYIPPPPSQLTPRGTSPTPWLRSASPALRLRSETPASRFRSETPPLTSPPLSWRPSPTSFQEKRGKALDLLNRIYK